MENININSIRIVDFLEEKSCFIKFEKGINIVTSKNTSRGKSSILRSIYHSMGAESGYDKSFEANKKVFEIVFSYGANEYKIIRKNNKYFCYRNAQLIKISTDYKQLATLFEQEFGLSVYLTDRKGDLDIAPTTYLFIPYFADQDLTWKLQQRIPFKNNKQFEDDSLINLYYYHMGILNKTYYSYNNKKLKFEAELKDIQDKQNDLKKQIFSLKKYFKNCQVSIDESSIKSNLDFLKNEINKYLNAENNIKNIIFENENNIAKFTIQIEKIKELLKDMQKIKNNKIECPNCGFEFDREINDNIYEKELMKQKLKLVEYDLEEEKNKYIKNKSEYSKVVNQIDMLTKKYTNDNASFENYLKTQTSKILLGDLESDYLSNSNQELSFKEELQQINDILNLYDSKKIKANKDFKLFYMQNLKDLGINRVESNDLKKFQIYKKSGSQFVRSMLAYFITILQLKNKYNKSNYNFPLIIDSPLDGEQDDIDKSEIIKKIFEFYNSSDMKNQMIIATLNGHDIFENNNDINFIDLKTEKEHLLTHENYISDLEEIKLLRTLTEDMNIQI